MKEIMSEEKIEEFIRKMFDGRPESLDKILNAKKISGICWNSFLYIAVHDWIEIDMKMNPSRWQHKPKN